MPGGKTCLRWIKSRSLWMRPGITPCASGRSPAKAHDVIEHRQLRRRLSRGWLRWSCASMSVTPDLSNLESGIV